MVTFILFILQTNNYQVIIISNVTHTYVISTYICGEMQWSAVGRNKAAVVGINAQGEFYRNHPLSGYSGIENAVSCADALGKRRKRQCDDIQISELERMPCDDDMERIVGDCLRSIRMDENVNLRGTTPEDLAKNLDPCPCTLRHALADFGRYVKLSDSPLCFVSAVPRIIRLVAFQSSLTQVCCYNDTDG